MVKTVMTTLADCAGVSVSVLVPVLCDMAS